jgi:GAF domain-containing protein
MELPLDGTFVEEARQLAIRSAVGVPIVVDGVVWGVAIAASTREEPFPEGTETRLVRMDAEAGWPSAFVSVAG